MASIGWRESIFFHFCAATSHPQSSHMTGDSQKPIFKLFDSNSMMVVIQNKFVLMIACSFCVFIKISLIVSHHLIIFLFHIFNDLFTINSK